MYIAKKLYLELVYSVKNEIKNNIYIWKSRKQNISHKISLLNLKYKKIKQFD